MEIVLISSIKAATHFGPDFLTNSEIYKNTKFGIFLSVFKISQKLIKEHSEEILNVECLEYSSPSWTRPILATDQAVMWAKAKVCVYAIAGGRGATVTRTSQIAFKVPLPLAAPEPNIRDHAIKL